MDLMMWQRNRKREQKRKTDEAEDLHHPQSSDQVHEWRERERWKSPKLPERRMIRKQQERLERAG